MIASRNNSNPQSIVCIGAIVFAVSIALAYLAYPHWVTYSHFAAQWYTFALFAIAMSTAMLELWYIASKLSQISRLGLGAHALRASAVCVGLVLFIPYLGGATQKSIHNLVTLLFVIFAALGFASLAQQLRNYILGALSAALFGICVLELLFLAQFNTHPVYPWVWVALELTGTAALILGLYIIATVLSERSDSKAQA